MKHEERFFIKFAFTALAWHALSTATGIVWWLLLGVAIGGTLGMAELLWDRVKLERDRARFRATMFPDEKT